MNVKIEQSHESKPIGRRARIGIAAFVALFSAGSCMVVLIHQPTWPAALAVAAELGVVGLFCHLMLRRD